MTDDDYDALSQKQLAKRDMRISLEDAAVRATYKVMAELETEPSLWRGAKCITTAGIKTTMSFLSCHARHNPQSTCAPKKSCTGKKSQRL
jgi:hypothetical protein